ncbi:hypothetical protein E4U21_007662 [Claviceps maximensis]|nr:hypothetical protein E4U21_007662 [Claviceps maximensis]
MSRHIVNGIPSEFVDSKEGIMKLVDSMYLPEKPKGDSQPQIFMDLEGKNLSRAGNISLATILIHHTISHEQVFIVDIYTLQRVAFETQGSCGKNLKDILESPKIIKVFFDVRNDSDALFTHYGIKLQGVRDIQVMENATRRTAYARKRVAGLSKCVTWLLKDLQDGRQEEIMTWMNQKASGERLWNPVMGGSYKAFDTRPLPKQLVEYCAGDVQKLPALYQKYFIPTPRWRALVAQQAERRVTESHQANYLPHGSGKVLSSWTRKQGKLLDTWGEVQNRESLFPFKMNLYIYLKRMMVIWRRRGKC